MTTTKRKRKRKGTNKLSDAKVIRLREMAAKGATYLELGKKFGIHHSFAGTIAKGGSYADVGGPIAPLRHGPTRGKKKRTTTTSSNGRPGVADFAALSIDDAARFLQALAAEWPKIRESFLFLDAIVTRQHDEE